MLLGSPRSQHVSGRIIRAAIEVHRQLGPGLLESAYEACLACELDQAGLALQRQLAVPLQYKHLSLEAGFRADLVVEREVLVEVKAVEKLHRVVDAQVLTYLRLLGLKTGLINNFHVPLLKDGIRRVLL